jgi:hypothetical protein
MARGDVHWFAAYAQGSGIYTTSVNLSTDTIKLAFIGNGTTCSIALANPTWGAAGSTNLSSFECATSTGYITGGVTLATVTWSLSNSTVALAASPVTIAQDTTGFTTAYWAIGYDSTSANKYALFFVDLGGPVGISAGALTITWNAGGIVNRVVT